MTNSSVLGSYVVTVSIPRTLKSDARKNQENSRKLDKKIRKRLDACYYITYVASMPQLRHCKATLDRVIFSIPKPLVMMVVCTKKLDGTTPANINENGNIDFQIPITTTNRS